MKKNLKSKGQVSLNGLPMSVAAASKEVWGATEMLWAQDSWHTSALPVTTRVVHRGR